MPGSFHSGSASCDECGQAFPDELHFFIYTPDDYLPVTQYVQDDGKPLGSVEPQLFDLPSVLSDLDIMYDFVEVLEKAGLEVMGMSEDEAAGMWEVNLAPQVGLGAVDVAIHV